MTGYRALLVLGSAIVIGVTGCKSNSPTAAGPEPAAPTATIDMSTAGMVSGTIHFAGTPPQRVEIDMGQDPACGLTGGTNLSEQYVVHNGRLANVFVSITGGLGNKVYAAPANAINLDQKGCRYTPHVIGVMAGQPVEFTNSDPTMHNVHTTPDNGNPEVNISQPPKAGTTRQVFTHPATMLAVHCANHPWMQAFLNIASSPFYAVSDTNGHFEIRGLPPGTYTLTAVHEELGTQTAQVTVQSKQTAAADFSFSAAHAAGQ